MRLGREVLAEELEAWREAYECLRKAMRLTLNSKTVPGEKKDAFHLQLELLSDDAQDIGDMLESALRTRKQRMTRGDG